MPALTGTGIADIVTSSLPHLGRLKMTDQMSKYHDTIAVKRIFNQKKRKVDSGPEIRFNIINDVGGSFRFVPMGFTATANIKNVLDFGKVPWRFWTWNWSMIDEEEIMNSGASKIVDLMKSRRISELASMIVGLERHIWTAPDANDEVGIYPIPYYIVKSNTATTTNDGFNGTLPSGFSTVANIDSSAATGTGFRYRNYATQYTTVAKTDLIRKMRRGAVYTNFKPLTEDFANYEVGDDKGWYTNYPVLSILEEILEAQNENLGKDIASMDGKVMFRGAGMTNVQELDLDTTNPVYGIQWSVLGFTRMRDRWMKDIKVGTNPNQPTVATVHNVSGCNTTCEDRRQQMVFATDTTMPS